MAFGLNNDKNIPATAATASAKANSFKQHLKRWMGWRPKRSQQNTPSVQCNNNYLMISSGTNTSTQHYSSSLSPLIPKDDQSTVADSTPSDTDHLQQQKPYDEGLARLSNYTDDSSHLDYTLHSGSYSSNNITSTNRHRHRPTVIDTTNIVRTKTMNGAATYHRLTGPLTTSAFSDITNSAETSPISAASVTQALPLSPSWDPELQQGRDASLIDSDLSALSNSLSNIGSTSFAQLNARYNSDNKHLELSEWLSDSENEDDHNNGAASSRGNNNTTALHHDSDLTQNPSSSLMNRGSDGSWSPAQYDTNETTTTIPSTFFTSSASPSSANQCPTNQYLDCDYYDAPSLENACKMNDPGSTTSFFTTNSSFTHQDMEDNTDLAYSSAPFASSSLDTDTMFLVTHAVNFLKSREDSTWDDVDNNNGWPYTQTLSDISPTATKTSSRKTLHADITPSPSTSTASTLVPSGGRKMASLLQDKNIHGSIPKRKETTDEEIHRIVSTHVLF